MGILQYDTDLLLWINSMHNTVFDTFMWNVSSKYVWIPMYVLMAFLLFKRYGWRSLWLLLALGVAFGLSDYISHLIKHIVCRPRPTRDISISELVQIVNKYRGGKYGFPSSHAADSFSIALLFSIIWRDWRTTLPLMLWVALNCWSRMYLGVHYPSDILAGLVLATLISLLAYWIIRMTKVIKKDETSVSPRWLEYAIIVCFAITLSVCFFL